MSLLKKVPELSLDQYTNGNTKDKQQFISDLFTGLKYYGFIIIKDHPVPVKLLDQAYSLCEQFFSQNNETKKKYICTKGGGQRGYTPFGTEHAKGNHFPDLKEFWHVGQFVNEGHEYFQLYPENLWPTELPEFQSTFTNIYKSLEDVGKTILSALGQSLQVESNYFSDMVNDGNSILRLLHYPPIPDSANPNCVRAAAHEDINLITILVSATTSGLELLDRDGKWLPVETAKNNLIVDAGDMLSRITNEVIPSTTHRVVNPMGENKNRYSMPFFMHPHPKAMLSCIESCKQGHVKYPDILSHDFLMKRLQEIGLTK